MPRSLATITGASRGLGRSLSIELSRAGFDVVGFGRDQSALAETARYCEVEGAKFTAVGVDLTDEAESVAAFRELPPADLAIANAGVLGIGAALELTRTELNRILMVNTVAAFEFLRESAATMISAGTPGRLLVIASDAAYKGIPSISGYVASKHAIAGYAKTLEEELAHTGVSVTIAYPAGIDTEMTNPPRSEAHLFMNPNDVARTLIQSVLATGTTVRVKEIHLTAAA